MQTTLQPAFTAGTSCGSISSILLCVLMQTTSGFCARTAAKSVVILTSQGRPSSSPTVFPSLAGLVTMTPQMSMSFGRSRMYPKRPWPIMPVPHSATLIMCRSSSRGCNHAYNLCKESHSSPVLSTGVAAGARRRTQVTREASRPAADGCGGARREAGAARSEERRWRRLVDRVRREDGKLFAHHRSLVEVAPVGERDRRPACYVGGRRRSTTWTPLWLPATAKSRLLVGGS